MTAELLAAEEKLSVAEIADVLVGNVELDDMREAVKKGMKVGHA